MQEIIRVSDVEKYYGNGDQVTKAGECPVGAISAGASQYEIDANSCVDCGTCAGVCPTGAIAQG